VTEALKLKIQREKKDIKIYKNSKYTITTVYL
jgi:hypothetical protein